MAEAINIKYECRMDLPAGFFRTGGCCWKEFREEEEAISYAEEYDLSVWEIKRTIDTDTGRIIEQQERRITS